MSYQSIAQLTDDVWFAARIRSCTVGARPKPYKDDARPDWVAVADASPGRQRPEMYNAFARIAAAGPGFAETAGDPPRPNPHRRRRHSGQRASQLAHGGRPVLLRRWGPDMTDTRPEPQPEGPHPRPLDPDPDRPPVEWPDPQPDPEAEPSHGDETPQTMALRRVSIPSPNYSSRSGATVTTIVIHTAQGSTSIESLGAWFQNPASGVSSHTGIDDKENTVGEYVPCSGKAWTAASANPWSIQTELCAASLSGTAPNGNATRTCWPIARPGSPRRPPTSGIPIVGLSPALAQDRTAAGVCQHADLGSMGGGHWDCGPDFPIGQVL